MRIPSYKALQVNIKTKPLVWNDVAVDTYVAVAREVRGQNYIFFGKVTQMERLRNCVMMHLDIFEGYNEDTGDELDKYELLQVCDPDPNAGYRRRNYSVPVRWKKKRGSVVRTWNPKKDNGIHPSRPKDQRGKRYNYGRYNSDNWPSKKSADHFGISWETDKAERERQKRLREKARQRKAYAQHRKLMQQGRGQLADALQLTGLDYESTKADFKRAQRTIMLQWHPDRQAIFVKEGKGSVQEFQAASGKYMAALSFLSSNLFT